MNKIYCPRLLDLTCVALLTALLLPGTGSSGAAAQDGPAVVRVSSDPVVISSDRAVFHTFGGWIIELAAGGSAVLGYAMEDGVPRPFRWTAGHGKEWLQLPAGMEDARVNEPRRISADGSTVVWVFRDLGLFHWQEGTVTVDTGTFTMVWDLSADGSVVVGNFWDHVNPAPNLYPGGYDEVQPFRWTLGAGVRNLGTPGNGIHSLWTVATTVSADGSVVAGTYSGDDFEDFWRWTEGDGMARLNVTSDHAPSGRTVLSADGNVLIGVTRRDGSSSRPFRWSVEEGTTLLDPPGITSFVRESLTMSSDGRTVLFSTDLGWHRWRPEEGFDVLEPPEPDLSLEGRKFASADGSVIAGRAGGLFDGGAVIWDEDGNARWLKEMLESDYGLDLEGWTLGDVQGLSHDGRTITGRAFFGSPGDPDFAIQNYVVRLDPDFHTFRWVGPSDGDPSGDFEVAEHWEAVDDPEVQRVPGPGDTVVFDLIADPGYVVTLNQSREVAAMFVEQGTITIHSPTAEVLTLSQPDDVVETALVVGNTPGIRGGLDLVTTTIRSYGNVYIGTGPGADGLLTLREDALLISDGMEFHVGRRGGRGQVFVLGSELYTRESAEIGYDLLPVEDSITDGHITVRAGGEWEHEGKIYVGSMGSTSRGELTIATGGVVRGETANIGFAGTGRVSVSDEGSLFEISGDLNVGYGASGELVITDGGRVRSGDTWIGWEGTGEVAVSGGGRFEANDLLIGVWQANGFMHVSGKSWVEVKSMDISGATADTSGVILDDSFMLVGDDPVDVASRVLWVSGTGEIILMNIAQMSVWGAADLGGLSGIDDAIGAYVLLLEGTQLGVHGELRLSYPAEETGPSRIRLFEGELIAIEGIFKGPEGHISGDGTIHGQLFTPEGDMATMSMHSEGVQVQAEGTISVGNSLGTLIIDGVLDQIDGVIRSKVADVDGSESDRLIVTGDASLGGTVEVFFIDGFAPREGDSFDFLEVGGTFTDEGFEVRLPNLLPGFEYETHFEGGALGLTALTDGVVFAAPELISPVEGEENVPVNPTLTWRAVDGATHYRVEVSVEELFRSVIFDDAVTGAGVELQDLSPNATHHWRVKAFGENLESAWSPRFSFVTGVAVSVEDPVAERPSGFRLHQNYPNPFNPSTRITYDLPEPAHVVLRVFDALGREVAVLVDQQQSAGRYDVVFDSGALPSGLYLYRMEAGAFRQVRRMVVVK